MPYDYFNYFRKIAYKINSLNDSSVNKAHEYVMMIRIVQLYYLQSIFKKFT